MKKLLFIFFVLLVLATFLVKFTLNKHKNYDYTIAILLPVSHVALKEIQQGFLDCINKEINAKSDVYNANGSRTLLRGQAEEIAQKNYNLVFCIATAPSVIMHEVMKQRDINTPLVCAALDNPIKLGLINSLESSGNNIVTVISNTNLASQADFISSLKQDIKKILLVYNPTDTFNEQAQQLTELLKQKNITLTLLQIFNINEIGPKTSALISGHDLVLILKDNLIVSAIESLISICNRFKVPLCTSDLSSVNKGAAVGYGVTEYSYGFESGNLALQILKNKKSPSELHSIIIDNFQIKVNKDAAAAQGLDIARIDVK